MQTAHLNQHMNHTNFEQSNQLGRICLMITHSFYVDCLRKVSHSVKEMFDIRKINTRERLQLHSVIL